MPLRSKKLLKRWTGVHRTRPRRERRSGIDRRTALAGSHGSAHKRSPGRRKTDLPNRRWPGLAAAACLGILFALVLQNISDTPAPEQRTSETMSETTPAETRAPKLVPPGFSVEQLRALRDEAERLTPAGAWLDENANEHWLPKVAELEQLAEAAENAELRDEAGATLAALGRVGIYR